MTIRRFAYHSLLATSVCVALLSVPVMAITPSAYNHYQRGQQLEKLNDFRGAEQAYRLAQALDPYDSLVYIRLAYVVERDGRKDEAIQLYQKALELNPKDSMIYLSLAQLWESKQQPANALECYRKLLEANPGYSYAYLPKARLEKALKQNAEAIGSYHAFLAAYPQHFDAQRELAMLQMTEEKYTEAVETYKTLKTQNAQKFKDDLAYGIALNNADRSAEALAIFEQIQSPSVVLYEQMGIAYEKLNHLAEAYGAYQKAYTMGPKEKYGLNLKMADIAMTLNHPDTAITCLEEYLKYDPDNAQVSRSLGELYLQRKDYAASVEAYQRALKHAPSEDKTLYNDIMRNLAFAQQMQGNLNEAIETYERTLASENNHQARINLALAYHKQGQYQKALELYRKLLVENPESPTLRRDLGEVLMSLGEQAFRGKDYKSAMNYYQDAYLMGGDLEARALLGMANTQYGMKNYPLAYTTYQRVLDKDPQNLTARLNKAQLDLDQKNYMEALENLRWVVKQKPDYFEAYKLLAQAHEALGDYGQAIINYQKALEIQPNEPLLLMGYGNVWRQVGDLDRAQRAYEMARVQSPDNALVRYNLGSVYTLKNQLEASLVEYRAALQLNPSFVEPYYGMGVTLEKQQKLSEALEFYQQYVQKAPPTASYLNNAKERIEVLKKSVKPEIPTTAHPKQPSVADKPQKP